MGVRELIALNVIIIIAMASMYIYRVEVMPEKISIADCPDNLGKYVSVQGIVIKYSHSSDYSFFMISDPDFEHSIGVFANFVVNLTAGATVLASGILIKHGSGIELQVEKRDNVKIINNNYKISMPMLLENPSNYENFKVEFYANVSFVKVYYLNLSDSTGTVKGYVLNGYNGVRIAYFCGENRHDEFYIDFASDKCPLGYTLVNISSIRGEHGKLCVHARIYDYGMIIYAKMKNYLIRVYYSSPRVPSGKVDIVGIFKYEPRMGEYVIYARNVK